MDEGEKLADKFAGRRDATVLVPFTFVLVYNSRWKLPKLRSSAQEVPTPTARKRSAEIDLETPSRLQRCANTALR